MMAPEGGRDAMFDKDKRTGKQVPHSTAEAPFYSTAKRVKPGESVSLDQFTDQPGAGVQRQVEGPGGKKGKLAKLSGADRFRLSIGIAEVDNPSTIHLTAKEWTVPWDVTVDQQGVGTGGSVSVEDFKGKLADIKPGVGYVVGEAEQFPWPQTPDEVKKFSVRADQGDPVAEKRDVGSWMLMSSGCAPQPLHHRHGARQLEHRGRRRQPRDHDQGPAHRDQERDRVAERGAGHVPAAGAVRPAGPQDRDGAGALGRGRGRRAAADDLAVAAGAAARHRYWWNESGAVQGEWTDPKGLKRKAQTDIVVTVSGFG